MQRQFGVDDIDLEITQDLSIMLEEHNILVHLFCMVRGRCWSQLNIVFRLWIINIHTTDGRKYNLPIANEVAGVIVGELSEYNFECDVIVEYRITGLQRITDHHPSFMSMTYPLIHPYSEYGFNENISLQNMDKSSSNNIL